MDRISKWRKRLFEEKIVLQRNRNIVLKCLVLVGFAVSGVLEHSMTVSTSTSSFKLGTSLTNHFRDGERRYCDPPNLTAMYYDSSEETSSEHNDLDQSQDTAFQVNLTQSEKNEFSRSKHLFWGMLISFIPSSLISPIIGPKKIFGFSILGMLAIACLCTMVGPRIFEKLISLIGFLNGALILSFYELSVSWFVPHRRNSFLSILSGKQLGYSISELFFVLLKNKSRDYIYFTMALIAMFWYVSWFTMVFNSPEKRKNLKHRERKGVGLRAKRAESLLLLKSILCSRPVWMSVGVIFGASCGQVTINKAMRLYLKHVYNVFGGYLPVISMLLHFIFAISCGFFVDYILKIKFVSVTSSKRMVVYVSHFIPAGLLFVLGFVGCNITAPIVFYCLAGMTTGANYAGAYSSPLDLSPKYAGIILSLCFTFSAAGSLFMDYFILYVLTGRVIGSWRLIFSITSLILLVSSIFFMLRGSGSVQAWNDPKQQMARNKKRSKNVSQEPRGSVIAPLPKSRTKSIYSVEQKILKVLHVQEPEKFTRVRAYSTSLPNERSGRGPQNVYRPSNKKRASIS